MNRKFFLMAGCAVFALTSAAILPVRADAPEQDEVDVTMAQLPAPVAQTLTREAAGGQVGDIDMELGNHKATYEADVVINKVAYDVSIAMDGTLLSKNFDDMDLTLDQLPAPVLAAVKQEMGDGTASDVAENYFDSGGSYYEATLQIGKHAYDMTVLPDGTLIKIELQKHEEQDADGQQGEHEDADQDQGNQGEHEDSDDQEGGGHEDADEGQSGHGEQEEGEHGDND
ncbi:MAG TPA: hypothetical protein VKJ65_12925 [Phycisphaerae bacterium]|nr:hypothetical protein [Phycisphaerae bacterium]